MESYTGPHKTATVFVLPHKRRHTVSCAVSIKGHRDQHCTRTRTCHVKPVDNFQEIMCGAGSSPLLELTYNPTRSSFDKQQMCGIVQPTRVWSLRSASVALVMQAVVVCRLSYGKLTIKRKSLIRFSATLWILSCNVAKLYLEDNWDEVEVVGYLHHGGCVWGFRLSSRT